MDFIFSGKYEACPRCRKLEVLPESEQCSACDDRDLEEQRAWVQFACHYIGTDLRHTSEMECADYLLDEFRVRWPYPAKPKKEEQC